MKFEETPEYLMGDTSQCEFARLLASAGRIVLPTYNMKDVTPETKAPVVFCGDEVLIAPDLFVINATSCRDVWVDVKAKSVPGWRKYNPGPRWEHGIDYSAAEEYREVKRKTGKDVWIVVHELKSPANPLAESELVAGSTWLCLEIDEAFRVGRREPNWPKRKGNQFDLGRRGLGGLLWWRNDMRLTSF